MKKTLSGLLLGATVSMLGYNTYNHVTSPEYKRIRHLENKAYDILSDVKTVNKYDLDEDKITVERIYELARDPSYTARLSLMVNDNIRFISEYWDYGFNTFRGDIGNLDRIQLNKDGQWITIKRDEINDYESWQKLYENLIEKIANKRVDIIKNKFKENSKLIKKFENPMKD